MATSDKRTKHVGEHKLHALHKMSNHADASPQALLSTEMIRAHLEASMCPYCPRGPFKMVLLHIAQNHGYSAQEMRDIARLPATHSLTAPETRARFVARGKRVGLPPGAQAKAVQVLRTKGRRETTALADARRRAIEVARVAKIAAQEAERLELIQSWRESGQTWEAVGDIAARHGKARAVVAARLRKYGEIVPDGRRESELRFWERPQSTCTIDGCERKHAARGLCRYHWRADRVARGIFRRCKEANCASPVVARDLCSAHYYRAHTAVR